MSRDELIRRAMLHASPGVARPGYAVGGIRDGGWAGAGTGSLSSSAQAQRPSVSPGAGNTTGGGGNNDRLGAGSQINSTTSRTERASAMTSPEAQNARLGPNAAQAMVGAGVSPDTAIAAARSINRSGAPAMERMAPLADASSFKVNPVSDVMQYGQNVRTPDMMSVTEATAPKSPLLDPNRFNFTNYGVMSGMQPDALARLVDMQKIYGNTLKIGPHGGFRSPEMNEEVGGATHSQHLTGSAIDVTGALRTPADTAAMIKAASAAGFGGVAGYNTPGLVHMDTGAVRAWGPNNSKTSINALNPQVRDALLSHVNKTQTSSPVAAAPAAPSIGQIKSADATAMAKSIQAQYANAGIPISSELAGQLAVGSMTTTGARQIVTDIKSKMAYTNTPEFQALPAAQRAAYQASVSEQMKQAMGVLGLSPATNETGSSGFAAFASSFDPAYSGTTYGMTVNPQGVAQAPGYNVFGPYSLTTEKGKTYPNGYIGFSENANMAAANPNYGQMAAAPAAVVQGPTDILSAAMRPNPAPDYYSAPRQVAQLDPSIVASMRGNPAPDYYSAPAPVSAPVAIAQANPAPEYYSAPYVAGVAPPVEVAQAPVAPTVSVAPQPVQNFVANTMAEIGRSGDDRDRAAERVRDNTQLLLDLGYTKEQIAAMTPEQIKEILKGNAPPPASAPTTEPVPTTPPETIVAARGGRMGYKRGGDAESSSERSPSSSSNPPTITLPPLPAWNPVPMPTYSMPSASPLIANFMSSLSQPIPAVQMPQYQSMVSPLQNTQSSFVNPSMGASGTVSGLGVNALRYNPMLLDERPDYALTKNDSISNALRLMQG
jgi:hypothetical protein